MVNLTLLLQIVHFFIAYYLLRAFLMKPVLVILESRQAEEQLHQNHLGIKKQQVAERQQKEKELWSSAAKQFRVLVAECRLPQWHRIKRYSLSFFKLDKDQEGHVAQDVARVVAQKVAHVDQ